MGQKDHKGGDYGIGRFLMIRSEGKFEQPTTGTVLLVQLLQKNMIF